MSRRSFAVCLGLLISTSSSAALAQQTGGYTYEAGALPAQSPNVAPQPQIYHQPVYQSNNQNPPLYQAGFHRQAAAGYQHHGQSYNNCSDGACVTGGCYQEPSAFWTSYYRNSRWPLPFRGQDVSAVTNFFEVQRENGWRMHNTVGNGMFDPQTNCLTQAGRNHIHSILRDNPSDRKVVFVLQGQSQQQTATRVQSTELAISELIPVGDLPPVYITDRDAPGSSGAYQTSVMQAMRASVPAPRLTSSGSSSGGSSSSGTP